MCMYFWAHTDNILTDLSCMYEQKDTYIYRHHTDMSVLDTYMSVLHTDKSECAYICLNVYVSDSLMDSILFVLSLYDVCISGTETCISSVSCLYLVSIILESAPVSAPPPAVSAPGSARLHRRLRGRIAVTSSSHRRIASAPHRVAARNAGDFIKITFVSGAADSLHAD